MSTATTLEQVLHSRVAEGELYELVDPDKKRVLCYACGHRCLIGPGKAGVCKVRYNEDGKLFVPRGYVGGLQVDPIEKKPFFHAHVGRDALSFGMLGCDLHCGYCFPGDTMVATERGPLNLESAFALADRVDRRDDADIAYPGKLRVLSATGKSRKVRAVFRHRYEGELVVLRPLYLPALRCTPDHRVFATQDTSSPPRLIRAGELTDRAFLAVPRRITPCETEASVDAAEILCALSVTYRVSWDLPGETRELIMAESSLGRSSGEIGASLGLDASYVRHVRSKVARGRGEDERTAGPEVEDGRVRFPGERHPGIPARLPLDPSFAELLGYYCAEGSVVRSRSRPNSHVLNFSFARGDHVHVDRVLELFDRCLGLRGRRVERATTSAVAVGKTSAALLFRELAGARAAEKRVPSAIFGASDEVVRAFLKAYVEGDGHRYENGKVGITTISRDLAQGIAWLALRLGYLPSIYTQSVDRVGSVQGRRACRQPCASAGWVQRAPFQFSVVWYEESGVRRKVAETDDFFLVPLREVSSEVFAGEVYNLEVEEEHTYLAGFFGVSNCQNWVTSQALRDPEAVSSLRDVTPRELVDMALAHGAPAIASTYNEPLITSEWAVEVFKEAKPHGLTCAYISNGNGTPEVLEYLRPWVDLYKVDLKSFREEHYRELGGTLHRVTETIPRLWTMGFWVEIVTLVIPGYNDDPTELAEMADFIKSVSPYLPWHLTAFHPDYKMTDRDGTQADALMDFAAMGRDKGLKFVYVGNVPGRVGDWENTYCPHCRALLVRRAGYRILDVRLRGDRCAACGQGVPGAWQGRRVHI